MDMKRLEQPLDELRRLRSQNAALNEQVKLLVKTEQRLCRSQWESDRQLFRIQALSDLALDCAAEEDESSILRSTCELLTQSYRVDGALTLCLDVAHQGLRVCFSASPAGSPGAGRLAEDTLDWARALKGPALVREGEPGPMSAGVARVLDLLRDSGEEQATDLLLLPLRDQAGSLRNLPIAWARAGRMRSFQREELDERQLPFLRLLASHAERALQTATLTKDLRHQRGRLADANEQLQASLLHLEQTQAQLLQAQKMEAVGRLAGGVAHDFNNLLTVILGHAQLLELALPAGSSELADVQHVVDAGERAANVARQLLAFSRQQPRRLEALDLNELVADLSRILERLLGEDVTLSLQLSAATGQLRGDRVQLVQALLNLVVNARDAMPEGGRLLVETRPASEAELQREGLDRRRDRWSALVVSDTGTGMPEEVRARAFEPFFTTKDVGQGTGLGLAMVYGIVTQAGGRIQIESKPTRGTAVTLLLPSLPFRVDAALPRPRAHVQPMGHAATILVVEDEPTIRALTARILREDGCEVLEAADGLAALASVEAHEKRIDLVLTDVVMPRLGGPELAARLRERRPDLSVLFMTGHARDGLAQRGVSVAEAECLHEPFRPDELLDRVRTKLRQASQDPAN